MEKVFIKKINLLTREFRLEQLKWGVMVYITDNAEHFIRPQIRTRRFCYTKRYPDYDSTVERIKSFYKIKEL